MDCNHLVLMDCLLNRPNYDDGDENLRQEKEIRFMKLSKLSMIIVLVLTVAYATSGYGAVSSEEAAKLGITLTGVGAEQAGNKEGTIPSYTAGLKTPPANFEPGSGIRPDPFAEEKPLFSINAQNMNQYADKLTEGTKALMKKYSTFRIDVYKTHRTVAFPEYVIKNTAKNAVRSTTANGGLSLKDAHAGYPFPIPKDGYEVMWNHLVRYLGRAFESNTFTYMVDSRGQLIPSGGGIFWQEFPYYDEDVTRPDAHIFWKCRWHFTKPARRAGEVGQLFDPITMYEKGRIAYMYLPGQRRVKLAPEVAFDSPNPDTSGSTTYDEAWMFNGSMERYNFKLIGKKEFYIPYNAYKATYQVKKEELFGPKHMNPDAVRWELHRMWVVEGTLKPGKRHCYIKRVLYVDEDSWAALTAENYDAHGNFFKVNYHLITQSYDMMAPHTGYGVFYDLISNKYNVQFWPGAAEGGYIRQAKVRPERDWASGTMAGSGVR